MKDDDTVVPPFVALVFWFLVMVFVAGYLHSSHQHAPDGSVCYGEIFFGLGAKESNSCPTREGPENP